MKKWEDKKGRVCPDRGLWESVGHAEVERVSGQGKSELLGVCDCVACAVPHPCGTDLLVCGMWVVRAVHLAWCRRGLAASVGIWWGATGDGLLALSGVQGVVTAAQGKHGHCWGSLSGLELHVLIPSTVGEVLELEETEGIGNQCSDEQR